jgi:hypothetical protein
VTLMEFILPHSRSCTVAPGSLQIAV